MKKQRVSKHAETSNRAGSQAKDENYLFDLLENLNEPPFLLILDQVQDPHNLGACMRSADAAGVHAVIAPKDRSVSITDTVINISTGAAENIPFVKVTNLARFIEQLQKANVWVIGTSDAAKKSIYDIKLTGPLAIVMGSEGDGIRKLTAEKCDDLMKIPMAGKVECLNVSVATGISLFEALRQRSQ